MEIQDDRTPEQKETHKFLVIGTDTGMGQWWSDANGQRGKSYAAWACTEETVRDVEQWVEQRGDMSRIRVVYGNWKPKGTGHAHIYVAKAGTHFSAIRFGAQR